MFFFLTDKPGQAKWLEPDEREALEQELKREKAAHPGGRHMTVWEGLTNPKVLILAAAYFFVVTGNYGVEFFMPSILERWYSLKLDELTWLVILPPIGSLIGQLLRRLELRPDPRASAPYRHADLHGGGGLVVTLVVLDAPPIWLTVGLFVVAMTGLKAYLPAFWSLPLAVPEPSRPPPGASA